MINVEIDLRKATNAEIDTLYGMPGFGEVLRELQDNGSRYNAVLTLLEPADESHAVVKLFMDFMRNQSVQVGNVIPQKPYLFAFLPALNPRQKELLPHVLSSLVDAGTLTFDGTTYRLTEDGFRDLY